MASPNGPQVQGPAMVLRNTDRSPYDSVDGTVDDERTDGPTRGQDDIGSRPLEDYKRMLMRLDQVTKRGLGMALRELDHTELTQNGRSDSDQIPTSNGRSPLPSNPRSDGRPAYEPPIFNYSLQLDDEYQKQRDALLKYYEGDVGKTTKYLDTNVEHLLLLQYIGWVDEQKDGGNFWTGLVENLRIDELEVLPEYQGLGITLCREPDGDWYIHTHGVEGRPKTESEANAIKAVQSLRHRQARLQATYIEPHGQTKDYPTSSKVVAQRLRRRLACGNCRKRKLRCGGPQGEGTTEKGCVNCVVCDRDDCHFNQLRYPQDQGTASGVIGDGPRSPSPTPARPALIVFDKSPSQTPQGNSWSRSPASDRGDVTPPQVARNLHVAEPIRPIEYRPQAAANRLSEATPLIPRDDNEDTQATETPSTFVLCGCPCS